MRKILGFLACLLMLITAGNVLAAGYTCPTYKKYTSCKSGYYISNCPTSSSNWTGQTISSSSLTTGNSCKACPTGYTCSGGLVCPKAKTVTVTYNLNGGSGTRPASKVCTYGSACSLQSGATTSFYRAGYVFKGWSKSKTATTGSTSMTFTANTTVYAIWTACAGGTYKPGSGTMASAACSTCTGATYSEGGAATCEPCPEGYDGDIEPGKYTDKQCKMSVPAGYYVEHTSDKEPTACATGMYKGAHMVGWGGNSKCNTCPAGYDDGPGPGAGAQTDCKINVSAGKYIATANSSTQTTCTAGYKCPGGLVNYGSTGTRTQCTGATYAGSGASTCSSCPGSYTANTTAGKTAASQCQINVSAGKYIATANSSTQSTCAAGTYKASHKVNYGSTSSCSACTGRTKYSAAGASSCSTVSSGYYTTGCNTSGNNCTGQTQCTGATYCASGVKNNCPSGYTANTTAGKTAASQCQISCAAGARVAERGATCTSEPGNWVSQATTTNYGKVSLVYYCPAGFFALGSTAAGHDNPTDCVISVSGGHYIPSNTMTARYIRMQSTNIPIYVTEIQAFASNAGTGTNFLLGKSGIAGSNLTNATNNSWSPTVYASGTDLIWDIGSVQTIGSIKFALTGYVSTNAPEVVMSVSNDGQEWTLIMEPTTITPQVPDSLLTGELLFVAPSEELQCSAGTFAATRTKPLFNAVDTCTQCTGATYSGSGASACTSCPSGYTANTTAGKTEANQCQISVEKDYYIASAGASSATECPMGHINEAELVYYGDTSSCEPVKVNCEPGTFMWWWVNDGRTNCEPCHAKYYCPGGINIYGSGGTNSANSAGVVPIRSCPSGYTASTSLGKKTISECQISVSGGKYIAAANSTTQSTCVAGNYKEAHKVNYGSTSSCNSCSSLASGFYPNSAAGSDAATDCYTNNLSGQYVASAKATSATLCANWTYKGAHTVNYGSTSSCTACPALTDGWIKATGTGWTSYMQCSQTREATDISSYCAAGQLKQVATGPSTWGTATVKVPFSATVGGYVTGSGASSSCSQCTAGYYCTGGTAGQTACVMGSYSSAGASSCIACADGKTTSAAGSASCNATCSNANDSEGDSAVKGWVDTTWNTNNTVSNLCKAASCLGGENGHYLDNGNCPRCDSFANGLYPRSSNGGTTKGQEACFLYTADIPGKYIASQKATSATLCQKGTYSAGSTSRVVHYGETSSCDGCPDNTYADEQGLTACKSCLENYTTYGEKTSPSACRILCQGGSYLASANATQCSNVGSGYWAPQAYVTQGNVGTRNRCATGLTTIGFGSGADGADDCGRVLHIGDGKLYLRSTKKTDLALNVNIGGTTYYGNMSTEDKFMSDGIEKSLKLNVNGTIYSVYDDSADAFFGGGETGISISPNLAATTIVPASYNNASGLSWSATLSDGTTVSGVGACDATTAENGDISADGFSPSGTGSGCWCKINSPAQGARYVYGTTNSSCSTKCGYFCANNMKGTSAKNITYRTNLYTTAGISVQ